MTNSRKLVLFDIDHTIFDTESYIENLYKKLALELGFEDVKEFNKITSNIYQNIRKRNKYLPPSIFLDNILPHAKKKTTLERLSKVFWEKKIFKASIYPDVKTAIKFLLKNKYLIGIFSTGDLEHQSVKIESLKAHLSEKHIHISKDKLKIIKTTLPAYKSYKTYLLDDLPEVLHEAKKHNEDLFTILIKRQNNTRKYLIPKNFKPNATIIDLNQFIDILKN